MAKRVGLVLTCQRQKKPADKRKTLRPCQSLSLSGEVARRRRDGEGRFRDEPSQSRCTRQLVPLFVACGERGASRTNPLRERGASRTNPLSRLRRQLSRRASPWQRGQVSSLFVNGRKKPPLSCKLFAFAKASPFRERWHGEAVTERVCFRDEPSQSRCARQLSREGEPLAKRAGFVLGRALGKEGRFRPHSLTAERIQLLSCKLSAFAKASPFRERWHGEAVTERVAFRLAAAFGKRFFHGPAERPSSLESRY